MLIDTAWPHRGQLIKAAAESLFGSCTTEFAVPAQRVPGQARRPSAGHLVTARGQYLRPSNYYRRAAFYAVPGNPEPNELFVASRASFSEAITCGIPAEVIAVPAGSHGPPGYFIRGGG